MSGVLRSTRASATPRGHIYRTECLFVLKPPAFLQKVEFLEARKKGALEVDRHEVAKVLRILRCEWVHGVIRAGHRVHEGREGAIEHLHKGGHGVFVGSAEGRVLEDVRHAAVVGGRCLEQDANVCVRGNEKEKRACLKALLRSSR